MDTRHGNTHQCSRPHMMSSKKYLQARRVSAGALNDLYYTSSPLRCRLLWNTAIRGC